MQLDWNRSLLPTSMNYKLSVLENISAFGREIIFLVPRPKKYSFQIYFTHVLKTFENLHLNLNFISKVTDSGWAWLAKLVRSLPSSHKVPGSIPGFAEI